MDDDVRVMVPVMGRLIAHPSNLLQPDAYGIWGDGADDVE